MQSLSVRISSIHQQGLFAEVEFPAGDRIVEYTGERISKSEANLRCALNNTYIFAVDDEFDLDGSGESNPARFINHSCSPNCEPEFIDGRIWIIALRDIAAGEELTYNYGYDLEDYRQYPCRCGAADCVGFIVAEEFFPLLRRKSAMEIA